jgi:hypothetical protein
MNHRPITNIAFSLAALACLLLTCASTCAQTTVKASIGWGDALRLGRWTPVFITVADARERTVRLEIHGTSGKSAAVWVQQRVVALPRPTTYALLYPLNGDLAHTQITVTDDLTGQTLATMVLEDFSKFTAAGQSPLKMLAPGDTLIGISGDIGEAMQLKSQLKSANLESGLLDDIKLPAAGAGYEGISALILIAPNLNNIDSVQQQSILNWVYGGGNLLLIPGSDPLPKDSMILSALPCGIGTNISVPLGSVSATSTQAAMPTSTQSATQAATQPAMLNGRELLDPKDNAQAIEVLGAGRKDGFSMALGLGRIAVLAPDVAPMQFEDDAHARVFWRKILARMVDVPDAPRITSVEIGDAQEDVLRTGPPPEDSIGRGPRESVAVRHLLELLGGAREQSGQHRASLLLGLAGLFLVLGPLDSILLMRLGRPPRHWMTMLGWIGLLSCLAAWMVVVADASASNIQVGTFRLIDQAEGVVVARTDLATILSPRAIDIPLSLDEREWWEPANQSAGTMGKDRFVDIACHEDRTSCRPLTLRLAAGDPQSLRGEFENIAPGLLEAHLSVQRDSSGVAHLTGKLLNHSDAAMTDIQVATSLGNCRISKANLAPGSSMDVNEPLGNRAIETGELPADVAEVSPDRTDRIAARIKSGAEACVYCQTGDAKGPSIADVPQDARHWQLLRALVPLGN